MARLSRITLALCAAAALTVAAGSVIAATPLEQVEARQAEMKKMGGAMKKLVAFVKGEGGSLADVGPAAQTIATVARTLPDLFPKGTAVGVGESMAKPEIWAEWDKFTAGSKTLVAAADALAAAAGNADQVKAAVPAVGKTCGGCHEAYRQKK